MLLLRSLAFNAAFYASTAVMAVLILPMLLLSRRGFLRVAQLWCSLSLWLLKVVGGVRIEIRHRERIPPGGLLVAAKHQSTLETLALTTLFDDPAYILKRELMWIPLFGWYLGKAGMVPINRAAGSLALVDMNARARVEARSGRQIMIFPEGTRREVGAPPSYKYGVAHLYDSLGVPCLPVALNSGLFWPRRRLEIRPGTAVIEILEPIPPGLPRDQLLPLVQARIEAASAALIAEGRSALGERA